jgi:hypothetical protein
MAGSAPRHLQQVHCPEKLTDKRQLVAEDSHRADSAVKSPVRDFHQEPTGAAAMGGGASQTPQEIAMQRNEQSELADPAVPPPRLPANSYDFSRLPPSVRVFYERLPEGDAALIAEYLRPDPHLRQPLPSPRLLRSTESTRATLLPPLRTTATVTGAFVSDGREYVYHSGLERTVNLLFATRHDTASMWEQPEAVRYRGDDGEFRRHIFDLLVVRTDGVKVAIDAKPAKFVERSGIRRLHELCAAQMPTAFADEILLITEKDITRDEKADVELFHSVLRMDDDYPDDDARMRTIVSELQGSVTIATLVEASELHGWGFGAAVRMIAKRELLRVSPGRIDYDTWVCRPDGQRRH